jgi:hypothetical protein
VNSPEQAAASASGQTTATENAAGQSTATTPAGSGPENSTTGTVTSASEKQKIEEQARQTPGVQVVANQLQAGGTPGQDGQSPLSAPSAVPGNRGALPNTETSPSPNSSQIPGHP